MNPSATTTNNPVMKSKDSNAMAFQNPIWALVILKFISKNKESPIERGKGLLYVFEGFLNALEAVFDATEFLLKRQNI